ncbi:MAG: hypothetical protein J7M14_04720, partial [Planctomycetes bacterium]|nr:hypothetical protein [Planctomycetota bacterium]
MRIIPCPSRLVLRYGALLAAICGLAAPQAQAHEAMWRARGPATAFSADWSKADQADAAATRVFLEQVWPKLKQVSSRLDAKLRSGAGLYAGPRSEAEKAAGVVCFPLRVEQAVASHAVPTARQVAGRKFDIYAARGQSEAVCVGVHATRDVKKVAVACSELVGPGTIPASATTVRLSLSWTFEPRGRGKYANRQMVLLNVPAWDIEAGTTREWVIDVHVPADAKAGKYAGKITVTVAGRKAAEFDLSLEVLPVTLSDNGCRWGAFMTPNPAKTTNAWCDLNARYGVNTLAWWNLDSPQLNWTWDGCKRVETILARLRNADGSSASGQMKTMPPWIRKRWDGAFITFELDEVLGLPRDREARAPFYKKPLKLRADLGELTARQASLICYDRPGMASNFEPGSIDSVTFQRDEALAEFDAGMK